MTQEIAITYGILIIAVVLFVTEKLRTDLVAILVMILLGWSGVITIEEAFSGFSSNAVIAIMGVMILGYGIDRSGLMTLLAKKITDTVGRNEKRIMVSVSGTVGIVSAFMQNIGAAALFLPALRKVGKQADIPASRLIMPMGFAAILGGTLTMVASGPLIVLNDLLGDGGYEGFNLFSVTPIGLMLLATGILLFYFFGSFILPKSRKDEKGETKKDLQKLYDLPRELREVSIPGESPVLGKNIEDIDIWEKYDLHILGISEEGSKTYVPWRKTTLKENQSLVILGEKEKLEAFIDNETLTVKEKLEEFSNLTQEDYAGFAEIIVPPRSGAIGKTLGEFALRKNFKVEPVAYIHQEGEKTSLLKKPMEAGLEMIVFGRWEDLQRMKSSRDFVVMTEVKAPEEKGKDRKLQALFSMGLGILLVILGFSLALSFFTGALLMVVLGVVPKEELYQAIGWRTVFLLAGLIPLGLAFEKTGGAELAATWMMSIVGGWGVVPVLITLAVLATVFSLFMSNVAATVLLVPLVLVIAENFGLDPRALALLIAVGTDNSFVLPTHPVNAFTMGPGGYSNKDYMKAGGLMTVAFLVVLVTMIYFFYL